MNDLDIWDLTHGIVHTDYFNRINDIDTEAFQCHEFPIINLKKKYHYGTSGVYTP